MTTYDHGPAGQLKNALLYGPEMLVFIALLIAWIIVFGKHLRNPSSRFWTSKVLIGITGLVGVLAPIHSSLRVVARNSRISVSGYPDPMQWLHNDQVIQLGTLLISLTAAMLVCLTVLAWLMPGELESDLAP